MPDVADAHLRAWIADDFGVELAALDRVELGADGAAAVWRGTAADGARYAVKWSGGGSVAGLLLPARLAELGIDGIAAPLPARGGELWSERGGRRLSLLPWVSDDGALRGEMTRAHWVSYGALLARVHAMPATDPAVTRLPVEDHAPDRVIHATRAIGGRLDSPANVLADPPARALADKWHAAADLVSTLVERAHALGRELRARPAPRVTCHTDAHLGNVLLGPDAGVWLIDWDDAALAPPERDLMFVIGGLPGFAPVSRREQSWFFDGYGPADVDPVRLAYYRCVRALEDITEFAADVLDPDRRTDRERTEALDIVRGELSGLGLAGLAAARPLS